MIGEIETAESIMLDMPSGDCFSFSEQDGLFEICSDLGEHVAMGQIIAKIWPSERTGAAPAVYRAKMDGIVTARHFPGLIKMDDCLIVIGVPIS